MNLLRDSFVGRLLSRKIKDAPGEKARGSLEGRTMRSVVAYTIDDEGRKTVYGPRTRVFFHRERHEPRNLPGAILEAALKELP